ncbi:MAG: glycerol kinase GlpK [Pseudomonadota bacterium]
MSEFILAIDQGTTSTRAIVFDRNMRVVRTAQREFPQIFPNSGWVEHDPEEIWQSVVDTCRDVLGAMDSPPAAIGITNQRETSIIWDPRTGRAIHNAIVWQDRRTAARCQELRAAGHEAIVTDRTGLLLDPYFSATKFAWILDTVDGAREKAENGELMAGTVDSWLIWRLTGGKVHATDATNAARTLLYNIHAGAWDLELCEILRVPGVILPRVMDSADQFGTTDADVLGQAIPICGVAGDQQAATVGQGCFEPGMIKSTYGTGCFAVLNTGSEPVTSKHRLLTTVAYQLDGKPTYALEGSIFVAGSAVQWLRDGLKIIETAEETGALAAQAEDQQQVTLVPAFVGMGAPYWDADCRGALFGLTRNTGPAEMARAALEAVGFQTRDLIEAMRGDWPGISDVRLRVDGGMTASDWAMQFLADILGAPVDRPQQTETTALGAAWLAGMQAGVYPGMAEFADTWALERRFEPALSAGQRDAKYAVWQDCVRRTLTSG